MRNSSNALMDMVPKPVSPPSQQQNCNVEQKLVQPVLTGYYESTLKRRCQDEFRWHGALTDRIFNAYCQFLHLKSAACDWDDNDLLPPPLVDKMWTQHILDLRNYSNFCTKLFGEMIYRNPAGATTATVEILTVGDGVASVDSRRHATKVALRIVTQLNRSIGCIDEEIWDYSKSSVIVTTSDSDVGLSQEGNANPRKRLRTSPGAEQRQQETKYNEREFGTQENLPEAQSSDVGASRTATNQHHSTKPLHSSHDETMGRVEQAQEAINDTTTCESPEIGVVVQRDEDVIGGFGSRWIDNMGTKTYRNLVRRYAREYHDADNFALRREIVSTIISRIRGTNPPGRFLNRIKVGSSFNLIEQDERSIFSKIKGALELQYVQLLVNDSNDDDASCRQEVVRTTAVTQLHSQSDVDCIPNENDILIDTVGNSHPGNRKFIHLLSCKQAEFSELQNNSERVKLAADIMSSIRGMDPPGRFLKKQELNNEGGAWETIDETTALKIILLKLSRPLQITSHKPPPVSQTVADNDRVSLEKASVEDANHQLECRKQPVGMGTSTNQEPRIGLPGEKGVHQESSGKVSSSESASAQMPPPSRWKILTIHVEDEHGNRTATVKVKSTKQMSKLISRYAATKRIDMDALKFFFGDKQIKPEDTPAGLGLESEDILHVFLVNSPPGVSVSETAAVVDSCLPPDIDSWRLV